MQTGKYFVYNGQNMHFRTLSAKMKEGPKSISHMAFTRIQIDPRTKERPEQYCVFHEEESFGFT